MNWLDKMRGIFSRQPSGPTVASVMPAFLASRQAKGLRPVTMINYGCFARRAVRLHGGQLLAAIDDAWMRQVIADQCSDEAGYYLVLLRWVVRENILPPNHPLPRLPETPRYDRPRPCYMLAGDVRTFLAAVREVDAAMLPAFILGFYAGLRPMEICRIRWQEILVIDRRLSVLSSVSKTRRLRLVEHVPPLLWQLLEPLSKTMGSVVPEKNENLAMFRWLRVRKAAAEMAAVPLGHDIIRHTFATHLVALTGNLAVAAHVLGHQDLRMISEHYNGVATRAEGMAYFDLDATAAATYRTWAARSVAGIYSLPSLTSGDTPRHLPVLT